MEFLIDKQNINTRRTWLKWIAGSAVGVACLGIFGKKVKPKMVKMLTQDGKLVEIPSDKLPSKMRKVSKEELQAWVWKHNS